MMKTVTSVFALLTLSCCVLCGDPVAAILERIGNHGGVVRGVAVIGNHAYVGIDDRVLAIDITDIAACVPGNTTAELPGDVVSITAAGDYLYVLLGAEGMAIVDGPLACVHLYGGGDYWPGAKRR